MSRIKIIFCLAVFGVLAGLFLVPKKALDGALWSLAERRLAERGLQLTCQDPSFGFSGLSPGVTTGSCVARYALWGAELEKMDARLSGLFPPEVSLSASVFGDECSVIASQNSINVKHCGLVIAKTPPLQGFGFTAGQVSFSGIAKRSDSDVKAQEWNISAPFEISGLDHPTLSSSKLGVGPQAKVVFIPAFTGGGLKGVASSQAGRAEVKLNEVISTIMSGSGEFSGSSFDPTNNLAGQAEFSLTAEGQKQFGPLLAALAGASVPDNREDKVESGAIPSDTPLPALPVPSKFSATISGTFGHPALSLRVLKDSDSG